MLAVGAPLTTTTTILPPPFATATTTTTTTSPVSSPSPLVSRNVSLNVPQGDQPGPPFNGGNPHLPTFWKKSTHRELHLKNRYGLSLEMWPNGHTQGVIEPSLYHIFVFLSHMSNLVIKGYVSDRYLCMKPETTELYTRKQVHADCYIRETVRNGSSNLVYSYINCLTPENKRCYLGTYRNGTMRTGALARQSQYTAQWLLHSISPEDYKNASDLKERIRKEGGWLPPTTPPPLLEPSAVPRIVNKKEQKRKRVRRWCRNLTVILKRPQKFLRRCKRDCGVLKDMIRNPERHKRRCLKSLVRRRMRNHRAKKGSLRRRGPGQRGKVEPGGRAEGQKKARVVVLDKRKVSATVQRLLPRMDHIFQRLRRLRRCKNKNKRRPCTKREVRRNEMRRRHNRKENKSSLSSSPSSTTPSAQSTSRSAPRKIRHQRKRTNRQRHRTGKVVRHRDRAEEEESKSKSVSLTASSLTSR